MLSSLIFFALLHVVCGLSIERPRSDSNNNPAQSAHLQSRGLDTGSKVAIGICVPAVAFVFGLGLGILWFYPAQVRKLKKENPGAQVGLRELMNGKVTQRPAPPQYTEHDASTANKPPSEASDAPGYQTTKSDSRTASPPLAEARHAALGLR
jgi:hypothetical protein